MLRSAQVEFAFAEMTYLLPGYLTRMRPPQDTIERAIMASLVNDADGDRVVVLGHSITKAHPSAASLPTFPLLSPGTRPAVQNFRLGAPAYR